MNRRTVVLAVLAAFLTCVPATLDAQSTDRTERGFTAFTAFEASSGSSGAVLLLDNSIGYDFNKFIGADVGVPLYWVQFSPGTGWSNTLGAPYFDVRFLTDNPRVNYSTTFSVSVPAIELRKLTKNQAGWAWQNHVDVRWSRLTPFANASFANGLVDTPLLFAHPFRLDKHRAVPQSPLGDFEAGSTYRIWRSFRIGGSANALETLGEKQSVPDDRGIYVFTKFNPAAFLSAEVGYDHSFRVYGNSIEVILGLDWKSLLRNRRH